MYLLTLRTFTCASFLRSRTNLLSLTNCLLSIYIFISNALISPIQLQSLRHRFIVYPVHWVNLVRQTYVSATCTTCSNVISCHPSITRSNIKGRQCVYGHDNKAPSCNQIWSGKGIRITYSNKDRNFSRCFFLKNYNILTFRPLMPSIVDVPYR